MSDFEAGIEPLYSTDERTLARTAWRLDHPDGPAWEYASQHERGTYLEAAGRDSVDFLRRVES